MNNRTKGVKTLVHDVLAIFPKPYNEDIVLDVCVTIEHNPAWRSRYDELCDILRDSVVNASINQYDVLGGPAILGCCAWRYRKMNAMNPPAL